MKKLWSTIPQRRTMTTEVLQDSLMLYLLQGMSFNNIIDVRHFLGRGFPCWKMYFYQNLQFILFSERKQKSGFAHRKRKSKDNSMTSKIVMANLRLAAHLLRDWSYYIWNNTSIPSNEFQRCRKLVILASKEMKTWHPCQMQNYCTCCLI